MTRLLALLLAQLLLAISITFENQLVLVPAALLPVLVLEPGAFRMLLRWKLLAFLAVMVGGVPLLLGDRTATFMGIPYAPEYVRATAVMAERSLVILLALKLFTSRLSLEELAERMARTRFRQFGEAFTLAMELLPQLKVTATDAYQEYRQGLAGRNAVRHTLGWSVEVIARVLVHAEEHAQERARAPQAASRLGAALLVAAAAALVGPPPAAAQSAPDTEPVAAAGSPGAPASLAGPAEVGGDTARIEPVYHLGEIVVLGRRNEATRAATVHEVDRASIEALGIRSPRDAMEHVPGVYFSRNGRNESTFQLRGFDQRQVSVFLDGVPVSLAYDGLVDVSQFVGSDLERVHVSHGFSSLLYGANSLGGAVSLTTRPPSAGASLAARAEGSDHGRRFGSAEFSAGTDRLRVSGSAAREWAPSFTLSGAYAPTLNEEGGQRANSSYDRRRAGLRGQLLITENHHLGLHVTGTDNAFDVPPNAVSSHARFWRFPVWRKGMASLTSSHELGPDVRLRTALFHDRYRNVLRSFDDETYTTQERRYAFDSEYDDYATGLNLYPSLSVLGVGTTDAAVSYRRDVHRQRDGDDPFERFATDVLTVALEQDLDWRGPVSMMAGASLNHLRPVAVADGAVGDVVTEVNAQWALRVRHGDGLSSRAALARKSRFPTMKELYSGRLGQNLANPDLRAEMALHAEVGLDLALEDWRASVSLFRSDLRDLIADVVVEDGFRQMQNVARARMDGAELDVRRLLERGSVGLNYSYLRAANTSPDRASRHLPYRPAHRLNGLADVRIRDGLRVGGELSHTARQYYQDLDTGGWERLDDMTRVNLRLEQDLPGGLALYARVDNALDAASFSEYGVPLPGRELSVGMKVRR